MKRSSTSSKQTAAISIPGYLKEVENTAKKSKITGSTPNEVIIKATKWLKHIDEEKDTPYTVKAGNAAIY